MHSVSAPKLPLWTKPSNRNPRVPEMFNGPPWPSCRNTNEPLRIVMTWSERFSVEVSSMAAPPATDGASGEPLSHPTLALAAKSRRANVRWPMTSLRYAKLEFRTTRATTGRERCCQFHPHVHVAPPFATLPNRQPPLLHPRVPLHRSPPRKSDGVQLLVCLRPESALWLLDLLTF